MRHCFILHRIKWLLVIAVIAVASASCDGDRGEQGPAGLPGPGINPSFSATELNITIDGVTVNSAPVVDFSVEDQNGLPFVGLTTSDLRFSIAKLMPGANSEPSTWQSYINRSSNGAMQASQERDRPGFPLGTLVDHGDGSYSYTFATDLNDSAANCPAPCTDADGNPLDVTYNSNLSHRVVIQLGHSIIDGLPPENAVYTFRPADGATSNIFSREIVRTENCNECHNQLRIHGSRVETKFCVTCHNPGTWDPNGNTADFKVMIHKIHRGEDLPSGNPYVIGGNDYSTVAYPQDIRNCVKCHDGDDPTTTAVVENPDTPQGNNWKAQLSMAACGSCHDDKDFAIDGSAWGAANPAGHSGGIMTDNSNCTGCHKTDVFGSVEEAHFLAEPVARANFKLNILKICGVDVDTTPGPQCAVGVNPTVTFSITDPNNGDAEYDITAPEIAGSNLSFLVAWDTRDYNNTGGTGTRPARADSIGIAGATEDAPAGSRIYTTQPASFTIPAGVTGSGAIGAQGRLAGDFDGDGVYNESGTCTDPLAVPSVGNCLTDERERIFVKSEVEFFRITDAQVVPRRPTVENDKCNQCHDQVSFHGGSRSGEYGVCILCHNPNNTDIAQRTGGPVPPDGKIEESIDFKRMIHGIHAGAQTDYADLPAYGFREKGLVVYGFNNSVHDYSHTRFPGILNDCETCHEPGAYLLSGLWASPTANGILSSTVSTDPLTTDPTWVDHADDLNISPTAAVCSACHDSDVAKAHMVVPGGAVFDQTQGVIDGGVIETCSVCHGPGRSFDVEVVHGLD